MPQYWCDSCQDYHDGPTEDDEDYDNDDENEEPTPRMPDLTAQAAQALIASYPQGANTCIFVDGQRIQERSTQLGVYRITDPVPWRTETCEYQRPRNAYGWAYQATGSNTLMLYKDPALSVNEAKGKLLVLHAEHPNFADDEWCNDSATSMLPGKWAGHYVAAVTQDIYGDDPRITNDTRHTCWHCAYKAGLSQVTEARMYSIPYLFNPQTEIYPEWMPNTIEVLGELVPETTSTIKDVTEAIAVSCGNCGRVGHRSPACTFGPKIYDKVGIEIEGRFLNFEEVNRRRENEGLTGNSDGSINRTPDRSGAYAYEFQTVPGSLRKACQQLVDYYPDEADASCGMHVHVSFDALDITMLNSPAFFRYFNQRWQDWGNRMGLAPAGQFFRRLMGRNTYCRRMDYDAPIERIAGQDRYHQLNFSSFGDHGTVECRLLPMFRRASLGVAAVQELLDIYETYLHNQEAQGFTWHSGEVLRPTLADIAEAYHFADTAELEVPAPFIRAETREIELTEVLPVGEGMVRIAMPINSPITLDALAEAVRLQRRAA